MEVEKSSMFSGWGLDQYEDVLAETGADAKGLEDPGIGRETEWLRRCYHQGGEIGLAAGADMLELP
jgi:hypothetical protein